MTARQPRTTMVFLVMRLSTLAQSSAMLAVFCGRVVKSEQPDVLLRGRLALVSELYLV
jgi:hypothetical protein